MQTPDQAYFVGLDRASALHPQTLLCYEMNGADLTGAHGAPLRLVIPVKYGLKNIKRIGTIAYTVQRPQDYWANEGYDWYGVPLIGHFHTGGVPGRHEINDTQELNYGFIFRAIADLAYRGVIAHEYDSTPGRDPIRSLEEVFAITDV